MMMGFRTASITLTLLSLLAAKPICHASSYNTSVTRVEGKLNVHLVPHTHDDAGWLRTVNKYYYGADLIISNDDREMGGVQYVLDTVIAALLANSNRKFSYGDMAFFLMWWAEQSDAEKAIVKQLVKNGQLDFVNGGYVQHDEAASHYVAMIDQTTVGHQFLNDSFGFTPIIGWQIDPFGHSSTQASLMCASLGFNALYFARTDYQDRALRRESKQLELLWRGAKSYGSSADVFTGNFPNGDYNPPDGFMWEWGFEDWKNRAPIIDCEDCGEYNVDERVDKFVTEIQKIFDVTYGDDIMLTMGTDFTYSNAFIWYKNMDKLIHYVNQDGRFNVFYSTPAAYTAAKHSYNHSWPLKTDDFFPYADNQFSYWTGYFTSRPTSKGYVRTCTAFLQAARQLEVLGPAAALRAAQPPNDAIFLLNGLSTSRQVASSAQSSVTLSNTTSVLDGPSVVQPQKTRSTTQKLERAVALLQHHDAITGTAKQDVADDYHRRLAAGMTEAGDGFRQELASLVFAEEESNRRQVVNVGRKWGMSKQASGPQDTAEEGGVAHRGPRLGLCAQLNASVCHPSVEMSRLGHSVLVAIYNPLGWPRTEGVRVPISTNFSANWTVTDAAGDAVEAQLLPVSNTTLDLQVLMNQTDILANLSAAARHEVAFLAVVPPLGYTTYTLAPAQDDQLSASSAARPAQRATQSRARAWVAGRRLDDNSTVDQALVQVSNGVLDLTADPVTGRVISLSRQGMNLATQLNTEVLWYNASDTTWPPGPHDDGRQPDGAYIFRPNGVVGVTSPVPIEIVEGPVVTEIRQEFLPWAKLTTRIWKGAEHIQSEWTAGPIPFEDGLGKELVIRYESNVSSGEDFYTDSNGREMLKRTRNYRPTWNLEVKEPVAGNYYPLTAAIYIQEEGGRQLAVVVDRAQGGASLKPGQVEVMVHRRILKDDARGVAQPLNETMCGCTQCHCPGLVARGTHHLTLQGGAIAARYRRTLQQQVNDPLILTFGRAPAGAAAGGGAGAAAQGAAAAGQLRSAGAPVTFLADKDGLPKSVHLLTLKHNGDGRVLLRLAHLYQIDEESGEDKIVSVDLNKLFKDVTFESALEVTLAAGKPLSQVDRLQWQVGKSLSNDTSQEPINYKTRTGFSCESNCQKALDIELQPMEIRTFLLVPSSISSVSTLN